MLRRLYIDNLALIDSVTLSFTEGLTVITGETGAGKSIVVQALAVLLGDAVHAETVKSGCGVARVEGVFDTPPGLLNESRFTDMQLEFDRTAGLRLMREIQREGRSRFLVNDQVIKKTDFQWLGHQLLDINSQHSHQLLLRPRYHLELLDGALLMADRLDTIRTYRQDWMAAAAAFRALKREVDEMEKRRQLIEYQMVEIDDADLRDGEKPALIEERERLRFAEEIRKNLNEAGRMLDDAPCMVTDHSARIAALIQRASHRDSSLEPLAVQAEALELTARDLSNEVRSAAGRIHASPVRLNEIGERLFFLQQLEGKFKNDIEGILAYRREIQIEHEGYASRRKDLESLRQTCNDRMKKYFDFDETLSSQRHRESPNLCRRIESALAELGMPHTRFDVLFSPPKDSSNVDSCELPDWCSEYGTDQVEFVFSANPGVPLKPVSQIASGGELSRVMMVLKQHMIESRNHQTMVLDEVDSGIGGDVANSVADRLKILSADQQIVCITHLPQIAVRGHKHLLVEKVTDGAETRIVLTELGEKARIHEIARMLSGDETINEALHHAARLLASASG
ncbi:DNA repair protein RecN [bacterium]|nr:DNA repair protein RecN [candidate division CSSED10-310 bacterium]